MLCLLTWRCSTDLVRGAVVGRLRSPPLNNPELVWRWCQSVVVMATLPLVLCATPLLLDPQFETFAVVRGAGLLAIFAGLNQMALDGYLNVRLAARHWTRGTERDTQE
jgi:hypothetical protein